MVDVFVLSLAAKSKPTVCFVPTASGDESGYIERFYRAFGELRCVPTDLRLFERSQEDLSELLTTDVIYVGGGSTANLLSLWRLHGLDRALAERAKVSALVVAGLSAGALCWFELGWVRGSFCPHYDSKPERRPAFRSAVARGVLGSGWAADDGAGLHFLDGELQRSITERRSATTYRLIRRGEDVDEIAQLAEEL